MLKNTGARLCLALVIVLSFLGAGMSRTGSTVAADMSVETLAASDNELQPVQVLESSADRILFRVNVPAYERSQVSVNGQSYDTVAIAGWGLTSEPGSPQLPMRRVLLGIPPDAEIALTALETAANEITSLHILPSPETVLLNDPLAGEAPGAIAPEFEERYAESQALYGANAEHPGVVARLAEVGFVRDQRVAAIELFPIQYNPVSRQTSFHSQILVELSFSYPSGKLGVQAARPESTAFEQLLQSQLENYDSARAWRAVSDASSARLVEAAAPNAWSPPANSYKIPITETGLYQLTYGQLNSAGLPVATLDPHDLQMFHSGVEIAIRVVGEADGVFDPADYVLFYAEGIQHKYTDENVYWLTHGQAGGLRMPQRVGSPSGLPSTPVAFTKHVRVEENLVYRSQWPGGDDVERWYWTFINPAPDDVTADVDLGHVSGEAAAATLWTSMLGLSRDDVVNPDHRAEFYINDQYVGEHTWDGDADAQWTSVSFPQSYLVDGTNTLRADFPGAMVDEKVYFDRFELDYRHSNIADSNQLAFSLDAAGLQDYEVSDFTTSDVELYDISDPHSVTLITDADVTSVASSYSLSFANSVPGSVTYLALTSDRWLTPSQIVLDAPSDLLNTANGADYIIISYGTFLPAAQTLAAYRAGQGLRTAVVDVEDVYDEFGYGLHVPESIHDFLQYAFQQWQPPAPTYVVLLGDGTYDPKNHYAYGGYEWANYIPAYLANVDPWLKETAADNRYVSLTGDDIWPDMVIGRLPANSLAEANEMVGKIMTYELTQSGASWNLHLVFVAGEQPDPLGADDFHDTLSTIIDTYVQSPYTASKIYWGDPALAPEATCPNPADCQQDLLNAINTGALLIDYAGHGARSRWSGPILDLDSIQLMTNADRFPIMLPMTCQEGYFITPGGYPGLSEEVVRATGRGAVASWGPTGLGVANGHDELNRGFFDALFNNGIQELGPATYEGKLRLYGTGGNLEQIEEYTLFGDPALRIPLAAPTATELASFHGTPTEDGLAVRLEWNTASEVDITGFDIYRAEQPAGDRQKLNSAQIPSQNPGTPLGAAYAYQDESAIPGNIYYYWLEEVNFQGRGTLHGPLTVKASPFLRLLPARPRLSPGGPSLEAE